MNSAIGTINFKDLSQGKPFYSIHAADDEVYKLDKGLPVYKEHKSEAPYWKFITVDKGRHGFIYNPNDGMKAVKIVLHQLIK